jgi:hypothetical protein
LDRKPRPPVQGKIDGEVEAQLIMLSCSDPPAGRDAWTLQLLCDELSRLGVVKSVCPETVRRSLKKTTLSRGKLSDSAYPRKIGHDSSPAWKKSLTSIKKHLMSSGR